MSNIVLLKVFLNIFYSFEALFEVFTFKYIIIILLIKTLFTESTNVETIPAICEKLSSSKFNYLMN